MSEQTESTQPIKPLKEDDTQPIKPIKKAPRWRSILISILGFLLLVGLGGFGGYSSGIGVRKSAEESVISKQLTEQYTFALRDIELGNFETATQRLKFIIQNDPSFPGAQEKLTEVMVLSVIPTSTPIPTVTSTPDFSGAESAYQRAQQLISAQDWVNALSALDIIRKLDPNYKTAQVDGMYYFSLRNYGHVLITQQGNLEGGIYHLTLAERFGPLDNTSVQLREGARMYITGASFWELDWKQAYAYFSQVGNGWPGMWDGTMTGTQRLQFSAMRYGDELFEQQEYCPAYDQFLIAAAIGNLDETASKHFNQADQLCHPPTEVPLPTATLEVVPTSPLPTDVPTAVPTP
jgi:tetratricopeptide (TPR) repeat protein